jgi:hypothetical protein
MDNVSKDLVKSSQTLTEHAEAVRAGADGAEAGAEAGDVQKVRNEADNLRKTAKGIDQEALKLDRSRNEVDALVKQLQEADLQTVDLKRLYEESRKQIQQTSEDHQKEIEGYQAQIEELSSERDAALQKVLLGIIVGSIFLIAISAAMVINGNPRMIMWSACGIISLVIANAMRTHSKIFATAGGIGLAICVGLIVWQIFRQRRTDKALEETVHSVEAVKQNLDEKQKKAIFGEGAIPGTLHVMQSEGTKELIAEKRMNIKPKIERVIG